MKFCPKCQKTYVDDSLNFCLEDGSVLGPASGPPPTVMMSQPVVTTGSTSPAGATLQSSSVNQPQQAVPRRGSSRAWLWITGIFVIFVLLCGGGGIVGVLWLAYQQEGDLGSTLQEKNSKSVAVDKRPTSSPVTTSRNDTPAIEAEVIDLSLWVSESSPYGKTEMIGDEFVMASRQKNYYYALVSSPDYSTDGASTSVVVRNVDSRASDLGYGLIFHSHQSPLVNDYAFLIDSAKKRFRIVRHQPGKEIPVIPWTPSPVINGGSSENLLEVRDKGDTLEFYINRQLVKSIKDQFGVPEGVPGLYSGDGVRAAFKNLEIRRVP